MRPGPLAMISLLVLAAGWWVYQDFGVTPGSVEDRLLLAELNREAGDAYRSHLAETGDYVVLPDGVMVRVDQLGDGRVPDADDWVAVHYRGWHVDERLFESTWRFGVPGRVAVARTIPGWQRVLTSIPAGTRARIVVPPELAYGISGAGHIGPDETLIFEIELLEVVDAPAAPPVDPMQYAVPGLAALDV